MNIICGDLIEYALEGKFDVIVHGCNCFCTTGAGIAKTIKEIFPAAYEADKQTKCGDKSKLGTYSVARIKNNGKELAIVNAYTQYDFRCSMNVDYNAIRSVFREIKNDFAGLYIAYPAIGAGLAGGNWNFISKIIDEELVYEKHSFVKYKKKANNC